MGQANQRYEVGQRVTGKVERLLPYGMFVCLADGTRAYIRRRELTWAKNIDPRELWQEGQKIEGVVLKLANSGQSMELTYRVTLPDPWLEFVRKFHQGDMVEGTVKSLLACGAFVEITPGVDGLIPLPELATWEVKKPEDVVWVSDTVQAVITQLDGPTRKLRLSLRARMRQLEVVAGIMEHFNLTSSLDQSIDQANEFNGEDKATGETPSGSFVGSDIDPLKLERVGRILVVDDYEEIRLPLVEWLQHQGYQVDEAKDAEEATEKVRQKAYGMLLVDLNLPGMDGLAFLRQVRQRGVTCHVAIMSLAEWLAERSSEIEEIGVCEAFVKPLDLIEIEHLLTRIGQGESLPQWQAVSDSRSVKAPESFYQLADAVRIETLANQLGAGLKELVATTSAEAGLIFKLDPISQAISITAHAGRISLRKQAIHALANSPVRDVIKEGELVLENQMTGQVRDRFRKLLDLLHFESCLGVPIEASGGTYRALFLFHHQPAAFNRYHLRDALAASLLFAVVIEREIMEQRFRSLNKLLLTGQVARGFSHEVYNKLSGLEIQLQNLQRDCRVFEHQTNNQMSFGEIQQATNRLSTTFNDLKDTVELFQQLMRTEAEQRIKITEVVQNTVALLRPLVREQRIKIETELSSELPDTAGDVIQLQQALLNIMLNAVQHMALKPGGSKILTVTTAYQAEDRERPIKIRFSDTGPGIHRRLWQKIFDLGFTTRLGGTGQGLYIARSLVESLGGKLGVEWSAMLIGATFLVELPGTLSQGE